MLHVGATPVHSPLDDVLVCLHTSAMIDDKKNPALQLNVAIDPWFEAAVSDGPVPSAGAESTTEHVAIAHVGSAPLHAPEEVAPVCVHVRGDEEERAYPVLHAYVATEPCRFAFVVVGTWPLTNALLSVGHVARAHVGAVASQATLPPPAAATEHVRTAAPTSAKPSAHANVAVAPGNVRSLVVPALESTMPKPLLGVDGTAQANGMHVGSAVSHATAFHWPLAVQVRTSSFEEPVTA